MGCQWAVNLSCSGALVKGRKAWCVRKLIVHTQAAVFLDKKFTSQGPTVLIWEIRGTDTLVPYCPNISLWCCESHICPEPARLEKQGISRSDTTLHSSATSLTEMFSVDKSFCKENAAVPVWAAVHPKQSTVPSGQVVGTQEHEFWENQGTICWGTRGQRNGKRCLFPLSSGKLIASPPES